MVNDTSTVAGALQECIDHLEDNLAAKGVTASYAPSTGMIGLIDEILNIQTGGSCYHIGFSEDSYVAVGGSATLEVYLQSNYQPLSGATVTVTGSDSSLYTGITNRSGIVQITVTNVTGTTTFTATQQNVNDTCTVTGTSYLFYDACDSSAGLSNYGSSECVRGSDAVMTMSYNSTENAYEVSGSGNWHAYTPIPALNDEDEYTISIDVKGQDYNYNNIGLFLDNRNDTTSYGLCFSISNKSNEFYSRQYRLSSDGTSYITSVSLSANTWYRIEYTVNGSSLTGKLYDMDNNLLATKAVTLSVNNKSMGIFMFCEGGTTNSKGWVRNIQAEALQIVCYNVLESCSTIGIPFTIQTIHC